MVRLLVTGASGYIGGTLLKALLTSGVDAEVFASVRKEAHIKHIKDMGNITPILLDTLDSEATKRAVIDYQITVVIETTDAFRFSVAQGFIDGLAAIKLTTGDEVHFFHTSGAKLFSSHTGVDTSHIWNDATDDIYSLQAAQKSHDEIANMAIPCNNQIIDYSIANGVKSYIVVPPIVYGKGEGFGNKISIQFVAIVRIGRDLGRIYNVNEGNPSWPAIHLLDLCSLYITVLKEILSKNQPPHDRSGFYFAEAEPVVWSELYQAISAALVLKGLMVNLEMPKPTRDQLEKMAKVLECSVNWVPISIGGSCSLRGDNARRLGWNPKYSTRDFLDGTAEEVDFVLFEDGDKKRSIE